MININKNDLSIWMDNIIKKEKWFVEPKFHVKKNSNTPLSIGILSPFSYDFSTIALGPLSIYHAINRDKDCPGIADRIFIYDPLADENGNIFPNLTLQENLTTFERRIPLNKLDLICISLTNTDAISKVLQILKLGNIPLLRADRKSGKYPLILAGGPGCINPEVFADFFDFFSIGDGCVLAQNIVKTMHDLSCQGNPITAQNVFEKIENKKSLYIPELYIFNYKGRQITNIESNTNLLEIVPAIDPPIEEKVMALAPEHGSLELLRCLGRKLNSWDILGVIDKAKNIGVYNYTLYLIVGFLSETSEDRNKTVELAVSVADKVYKEGGKITLKINPIIPTPGTACQRMAMPSIQEYKSYLQEIENGVKNHIGEKRFKEQISIVSLPNERLLVESVINRADRRISSIILKILQFRASDKTIYESDLKKWVKDAGFEWSELTGEISLDSLLPWQPLELVNPGREQKILSSLKNRINNHI